MEEKIVGIFTRFMQKMRSLSKNPERDFPLLDFYEQEFRKQLHDPTPFPPYHKRIPELTEFGKKFIRMSLDVEHSKVLGQERLEEIKEALERKENVILFANHQVEPDPQILQLLFGLDDMIFVAGDRVVRDPIAIPMSLGCNLLCIYSKKYIDVPPEMKEQKLHHNQRTLKKMEELLKEGGKIIYVAPSGGRDRKSPDGSLTPAPFDPSSIELFLLIAAKAKTPTHFYPLALYTYELLPPPSTIQIELGEERTPTYGPAFVAIGPEIIPDTFKDLPKEERRQKRSQKFYDAVLHEYSKIR